MARILKLALHHLGLCDHPEPWDGPSGEFFLSDKESTLKYLRASQAFDESHIEKLGDVLGKMIVAEFGNRSFSISDEYVEEIKESRVVRRGRNWLTVDTYSTIWDCSLRSKVINDSSGNGYWTCPIDLAPGYRERFCEISREKFEALTTQIEFDHEGYPVPTPLTGELLENARMAREAIFAPNLARLGQNESDNSRA